MGSGPNVASAEQARLKDLYEALRLRLLDLSKRNRMLNYKFSERSRRQLRVVDEVLEDTYHKLAIEEASFRVAPLPEPDDIPLDENTEEFISALDYGKVADPEYLAQMEALKNEGQDEEVEIGRAEAKLRDKIRDQLGLPKRPQRKDINRAEHARSVGIDPTLELPPKGLKETHSDDRLQTLKYPDELERTLGKISDDARLAEQEMGISTLFLAFGFLEWYESDSTDLKTLAPLLLLPVRLDKEKIRGRDVYFITARDSSAEANLSLQKLLEKDFNRKIENFSVADDESIGAIENYLEGVRSSIDGLKRWRIHRWLVLGHFAFGRFAMYSDLNPNNWLDHPANHPLLSSILSGAERTSDGGNYSSSDYDDYAIDEPAIEAIAPILIHDADASQHSAIIDVMKGKNLVIQGPPGTGKSQTITNIIANALGQKKRVLFLAEKQAALDVVKRRLTKAGLGDFCLELHSDKASPKSVIDSLKERVELGILGRPISNAVDPVLAENRNKIKGYLTDLHKELPSGTTPFKSMWKAVHGNRLNEDIIASFAGISLPLNVLNDTQLSAKMISELELHSSQAKSYVGNWGHPSESPWYKTPLENVDRFRLGELLTELKELREICAQTLSLIKEYSELGISGEQELRHAIAVDKELLSAPDADVLSKLSQVDLDEFELALAVKADALKVVDELSRTKGIADLSDDHFTCVGKLMQLKLSDTMLSKTPLELTDVAQSTIMSNRKLIEIIENMFPVLDRLGLEPGSQLDTLHLAAVSIVEASHAPANGSVWLRLERTNEPAFNELYIHWRKLRDNDIALRSKYQIRDNRAWPATRDLEIASTFLRNSGFLTPIFPSGADGKIARSVCSELGLERHRSSVGAIDEISDHVKSLFKFELDSTGPKILGTIWQGLNSPFDEIAEGREWLGKFHSLLTQFSNGQKVAEKTIAIISEGVAVIDRLVPTADAFSKSRSVLAADGQQTALETVHKLKTNLAKMETILSTGIDSWSESIDRSIGDLANIGNLLKKSQAHAVTLSGLPGGKDVEEFIRSANDVIKFGSGSKWLRSVKNEIHIELLRTRLTTGSYAKARELLSALALDGSALFKRRENVGNRLKNEFNFYDFMNLSVGDLATFLDELLANEHQVTNLSEFMQSRKELSDQGLKSFFTKFDSHKIDFSRLVDILKTLHAQSSAFDACRRSSSLALSGQTLEARRKQFAQRDREKIETDRKFLKATLLKADVKAGSNSGPKKSWTEMALLRNEFSKQKRFTPVRSLLARSGVSIQALKPVLMMSPLSLAKYADAKSLKIDLLVIDEASQMKPEDALGGVVRSTQIVVVGDQKQLPPTDFFSRSEDANQDDEGDDLDDESILENCDKTFRQSRSLKWHYRSRCESLIRFANENFYLNKLITFPACRPGSFSIDLVRVEGSYKAKRNVPEASIIAEEVVKFMQFHAEKEDVSTLGIVAVNTDQRDLIREEIQRVSGGDPLIDQYMAKVKAKGEEFFVKNLENVQGDERDYIFISMTYGRESGAAAMKQRFGPINRKQGHRRLNVLFSRARIRIALFCSFGSDEIKPSETSSEGVHVLKRYLKYVEVRGQTFGETSELEPDSDFEIEVAFRLSAKGYAVEPQVGVSGYRIDCGVRNPDHPERFLAGIECDGATYHSSKSARDRDRLREEILVGLGWKIIRVWSTDWFENPTRETEKLIKRLEELRAEGILTTEDYPPFGSIVPNKKADIDQVSEIDAHRMSTEIDLEVNQPLTELRSSLSAIDLLESKISLTKEQAVEALQVFRDSVIKTENPAWPHQRSILRDAMIETFISREIDDPEEWFTKVPSYLRQGTNPAEKLKYFDRICEIVARMKSVPVKVRPEPEILDTQSSTASAGQPLRDEQQKLLVASGSALGDLRAYKLADFQMSNIKIDAAKFYEKDYRSILRIMIDTILEIEAPIFEDVLVDRIARAHGFLRSGSKIYDLVNENIDIRNPRTVEGNRSIVWNRTFPPSHVITYRSSRIRSSTDTPVAELAGLAAHIMNSSKSDEDVLRKMCGFFDLERLRESTRTRFQFAINLARKTR